MGCGVSKDDIAEPRPMSLVQSRGNGNNNNNNNIDNISNSINNNNTEPCGAGQPSKLKCGGDVELPGSTCTKSFPRKPPTPPSVIIAESNWMPRKDGKDMPSPDLAPIIKGSPSRMIRVEEVEYGVHGATALAILSTGTNTPEDDDEEEQDEQDEHEEEYIVSGTDLENMNLIGNDMKGLPYAVGTFANAVGQTALIDALVSSTSQTIAMASNPIANNAKGFVDFPAMAGGVITISAPDLCSTISPVRKAEIIDLDEEPDGDDALAAEMSEPESFAKQQPAHSDFWSDGGTDDADTDDPVPRPELKKMMKNLPLLMLEDPESAPPDDEYDPGDLLPPWEYDRADYKTLDYMMSPAEKLLDDDASVSLSEYLAGLVSAQTTPMSVSTELGMNPHRNSTSGATGTNNPGTGTGTGHVNNNNNNADPARLIVVAKVPRYNEWASSQADADIESIDLLDAHAAGYFDSRVEPPTLDSHGIHKDGP